MCFLDLIVIDLRVSMLYDMVMIVKKPGWGDQAHCAKCIRVQHLEPTLHKQKNGKMKIRWYCPRHLGDRVPMTSPQAWVL